MIGYGIRATITERTVKADDGNSLYARLTKFGGYHWIFD
jgi:hypothetical protein